MPFNENINTNNSIKTNVVVPTKLDDQQLYKNSYLNKKIIDSYLVDNIRFIKGKQTTSKK